MKKLLIIGNWKMNKTLEETESFLKEFETLFTQEKAKISQYTEFGIAAPFTSLTAFRSQKLLNGVAQNFSHHESGAYTGEISAVMLKDLSVKYVILGHSERRTYYGETDKIVNAKMHQAIKHGLVPIVCVGETLEEYEAGKTQEVIKHQIAGSLEGLEDYSKIVLAYEPIWAIGTGKTATPEIAQNVCQFIHSLTSKNLVVQYGGSVSPENVADLMSQSDIDGALVGGASLKPESFIKLLTLGK
ncbi:triose-phosphate isomerase [Mycoplasma iguanae]|uniref:Triosephosphate isomerase n=1 Tax=Mycoplasma iguanae TaxID=292461 RepID=A0ABY5R945_9MOLU|nr:triose-phosphate isomerase [Mycoplasma iguanae]UVD81974.1 triose-phosphate isomerase [Mycoplasma iguanae]